MGGAKVWIVKFLQESVKPKPACLAPRASTIKDQGCSEAVAAQIEAPQRRSTKSVYEAKWTIFTDQPWQINWEVCPLNSAKVKISLHSWIVSIETDLRVREASPPGTFLWCFTCLQRLPLNHLKMPN